MKIGTNYTQIGIWLSVFLEKWENIKRKDPDRGGGRIQDLLPESRSLLGSD